MSRIPLSLFWQTEPVKLLFGRQSSAGHIPGRMEGLTRNKPGQFPVDHSDLAQPVLMDPVPLEVSCPDISHPEFAADLHRHRQGAEDLKILAEKILPHVKLSRRGPARPHPDRNGIMVPVQQCIVRNVRIRVANPPVPLSLCKFLCLPDGDDRPPPSHCLTLQKFSSDPGIISEKNERSGDTFCCWILPFGNCDTRSVVRFVVEINQ